jgi:hypothetical protein
VSLRTSQVSPSQNCTSEVGIAEIRIANVCVTEVKIMVCPSVFVISPAEECKDSLNVGSNAQRRWLILLVSLRHLP